MSVILLNSRVVSYITSVPYGVDGELVENLFMGDNTMDQLLTLMGGLGEIIVSHGVVGTSTDIVQYGSALAAAENYLGTEILTEYEGRWDSAQQQSETAKEIPISGGTFNYFRLRLVDGYPGVSIGSPPSQGAIAMKVAIAVLTQGPDAGIPHDIEVPHQIVTAENVKICEGITYTDGCNVFPEDTVGDENTADIL